MWSLVLIIRALLINNGIDIGCNVIGQTLILYQEEGLSQLNAYCFYNHSL